jgi:hypothetical protein
LENAVSQVVKVTKIGKSGKGKPIAYFDNRHGQTDGFLVSDKCAIPPEGATIDANTASWQYRDITYWGLNSWKLVEASPQSRNFAPPPDRGNGQSAPVAAPMQPQRGWGVAPMNLCAFVSNIVANAIHAGLIKEPVDIHRWTKSAYGAAESLRNGFAHQEADRPDPSEDHGREDEFDDEHLPF